jgi:hypothetical protein
MPPTIKKEKFFVVKLYAIIVPSVFGEKECFFL